MIVMNADDVRLRGEALHEVWWQGRQWAVTSYGLERRDGTYAVHATDLYRLNSDGAPSWPRHLAGKLWIDIHDFCTAFAVALTLHPRPPEARAFGRGEVLEACLRAIQRVEHREARRKELEARKGPPPSGVVSAAELRAYWGDDVPPE